LLFLYNYNTMNNFSLINIGSCYYDNNNIITFTSYININQEEIYTIEYETLNSWNIEWFKNATLCNEIKKIISWLNKQGSEIKLINDEICLIGVNLYNIEEHIITDTFNKIPFNNKYEFDYIDIITLKTHFTNNIVNDIINNIII
jgi:hypothetical protein